MIYDHFLTNVRHRARKHFVDAVYNARYRRIIVEIRVKGNLRRFCWIYVAKHAQTPLEVKYAFTK